MPRFTTLYSGSSGNAAVAEQDGRYLMVDMGASCKATVSALGDLQLELQNLQGILITHEHSDHIKGLKVFLKRYPVPVYASAATLDELERMDAVPPATQLVDIDGSVKAIGSFEVKSFATSHDAAGCRGYRISVPGGDAMAIATDLGHITPSVMEHLREAKLVALEANYDPVQLRHGPYPYYLKKRISSVRGHLSNQDSAETVTALAAAGCRRFSMCHLSRENNRPDLVLDAINSAMFAGGLLMPEDCVIQIARRHQVSPWMEF